ncbi:late sigma transcription factor [Synechococcus phage S-T4]|jgi:DNA-directed RNA polymerase specialized sigma subunit|uniref:RNA polymerase sigma-like factor n=1 Tax=Synechococcus phage S-T4 TaxID=2268578 RepID=A0A385EHV0_9CAUD|nr:late sigma transcription factor [Synechococcus phage S-T4]AXQ70569.1 RNA polymerase sigma factor for late transcription [Synechococcus phage S-T4]
MARKKSEHYVNNKEFLAYIVKYRKYLAEAEKEGKTKRDLLKESRDFRKTHEYIGTCFKKIGDHLAHKPNFANYVFKDDMISDGIENCIQYVRNFDPEKSSNPFAYFTQIITFAFLRKIQKEKRQLEVKNRIIEKSGFMEVMAVDDSLLSGSSSDYNTIKENIQTKMNR